MIEVQGKRQAAGAGAGSACSSPSATCPTTSRSTHAKMTAKLARIPALAEVPYPVQMEPHLVVEFYSR